MSGYSGGNRGRGRGRGGGGRGHSGGGYHRRTGQQGDYPGPPARLKPCKSWTTTGACPNGNNCQWSHVIQLHASIDATNMIEQKHRGYNHTPQKRPAMVTGIAIWETQGAIKIFTSSQDGFWRLWNTSGGKFNKEFEHNMGGGRVECLELASNYLFVGFEGVSLKLPDVKAGMIHAWNLDMPQNAPLEFHMHPLAPYAHAQTVTQLNVVNHKILSGSFDGVVRVWSFVVDKFVLEHTLYGHAGEIKGVALFDNMLWSCSSIDKSIRLWDLSNKGEMMHVITQKTQAGGVSANQGNTSKGNNSNGIGHTQAITGLLAFSSPAGNFCLSSSLDGTIKAWNSQNADCVASENHQMGVVSMALSDDQKGNPILLIGLETGSIMIRNVLQTSKAPAFSLILTLTQRYSVAHELSVKALRAGPSGTFYSGGQEGKLLVWSITGDLGL